MNRERDRRSGGDWSRPQSAKNWIIACVVRGAFALSDHLPARLLLASGRALGRAFRALSPGALRRARENAGRCLPKDAADATSRRCFEQAGENLGISLLLRRPKVRALDWVEVPESSRHTLAEALSEGRGAVFVSGHVGPFELLPAAIAELGMRPAVVVRESYDGRLDAWVDQHRRARGIDVIHRGAPGAAMRIVRALRAGQPVGFLPDLGGRVPQTAVDFLGRLAGFPIGPQEIARRSRAPIVVGTLRPLLGGSATAGQTGRFTLVIERVETSGDLSRITQRVATLLEEAIVRARDHFPWMASLPGSPAEDRLAPTLRPAGSRDSRIASPEKKALDLSTTCRSEGGSTWDEESEASRA